MSHPEPWNNLYWFRFRSSSAAEAADLRVFFSLIMSFSWGVSPIVRTARMMNLQFCLHWKLSLVRLPLCSSLIPCLWRMKARILQFLHVCPFPLLPCLFLHIILVTCMCVPDCRDSTDSFLFITSNIFHSTNAIYSLSDRYCLTQKHILEKVLKYIHIQKFYWHRGRKIWTTHEFWSINTACQKILEL